MKKTILLGLAVAAVFSWMASMIAALAPIPTGVDPEIATAGNRLEFIENPPSGRIREVTAYNVGVREQTSDEPCIGAAGQNLCRLVAKGRKVCAANFVPLGSILKIEEFGMCVVLDRLHRRFSHRVDIAMTKDEIEEARRFGVQRRYVEALN